MKILGISCSPREGHTTYLAMKECMDGAQQARPELGTEVIDLAAKDLSGCRACGACKSTLACVIDDDFQKLIPRLADKSIVGMIIGTPVCLGGMAAQCKAFLDRTVIFRRNRALFKNRVGGVLTVGGARNGGQELAIQAVHAAMLCHDMVIVGDGIYTMHFGATLWNVDDKGIADDDFGLRTARNLGRRVAELAVRIWKS